MDHADYCAMLARAAESGMGAYRYDKHLDVPRQAFMLGWLMHDLDDATAKRLQAWLRESE